MGEGVAPEIETPGIRLFLSFLGLIHLSLGLLWPDDWNGTWIQSRLTERASAAPTQPNQALTCRARSWGNQTHPNPPNILTSTGLLQLARRTRQTRQLSPKPPRLPCSSDRLSQCHGWAQDLSSLAPLTLPLWANATAQTRNKSSQCKLKTNYL